MIYIKISAIIVVISITILSLLPPSNGVEIHVNDKIGHFIAYSVLTINLGLLIHRSSYWKVVMIVVAYSGLMEFFQSFVPGREVSLYDLLANTLGSLIGIGVLLIAKKQIFKLLVKLKLANLGD